MISHDPYTKQQIMFQRTPPRYHAIEGPYNPRPGVSTVDTLLMALVIGLILGWLLG